MLDMSGRLADRGGMFVVDNADRHAHLTLYMARFQHKAVRDLSSLIKKLMVDLEPIRLEQDGYFVTPGSYYEVSYRRARQVLAAHELITAAVRSLRHSEDPPVVEDYYGPYSAGQRANVRWCGYDLAGELFRPHITITRFPARPAGELPVAGVDLSFTATTIGIFRADHLGAARELIQSFDLS